MVGRPSTDYLLTPLLWCSLFNISKGKERKGGRKEGRKEGRN